MRRVFAVLMMSTMIATVGLAAESTSKLSKKEVRSLVENASTPAEHNKLARYYRLQAERLDAEGDEHAATAKMYHARPTASEAKRPMSPDTAAHCEYFAESLHKAATEARALSTAHAEMAK